MKYRRATEGYCLDLDRSFVLDGKLIAAYILSSCGNPRKIITRKAWKWVLFHKEEPPITPSLGQDWKEMDLKDYRCLDSMLSKLIALANFSPLSKYLKFLKSLKEEVSRELDNK